MPPNPESPALEAFRRAGLRVPAYRAFLEESGVSPESVRGPEDWSRVPVSDKRSTFGRFPIDQLCLDGRLGRLGTVLTSSGHSGRFAYGLTPAEGMAEAVRWIDDLLDFVFEVRARPTLLINCLPMGVKVSTQACTLAETSVRPDMVVGLVRTFAAHFSQIILVGEAAFVKHTLEQGRREGVVWRDHCVHLILGEEPLAENARKYLEGIMGVEPAGPRRGMVVSSMGVAELGLNLFSEVPPVAALVPLRRALHGDARLRRAMLGAADWVPALFTYDPRRIFVEFDHARRLIVTTLDPRLPLPLVRYATGDRGSVLRLDPRVRPAAEAAGVPWEVLETVPIVAIEGRGEHVMAGAEAVYPEAVKEGLYHNVALAELTTANFRLSSGRERARVRIQLSPGVRAEPQLAERFRIAIGRYARPPLEVVCEAYADFGDGMTLDYERKFRYIES